MKPKVYLIGGGLIGLYSAYALTQKGAQAIIIDQSTIGSECSTAAGGILSPLPPWNYPESLYEYLPAVSETYAQLAQQLQKDIQMDIEYQSCGMRIFCPQHELAIGANWCQQHQTHHLIEPNSLYLPDVAQLNPSALVQAMHKKLIECGVEFMENTQVEACHVKQGQLQGINTSRGYLECETLLWTTGAWANRLSLQVGDINAPNVRPIKGQMITFACPDIALKEILYKDGHYLIPRKNGFIMAGSTLEDSGFDKSTTAAGLETLTQRSIQLIPELANASITAHWSGLRPYSDNNLPIVQAHSEVQGLYLNCGHHRYGICMAPYSAEKITQLILK